MTKKKRVLSVVDPEKDGLGLPTIMDREVAAKHGAKYVHLAAFAIDVDRVRDEVETDEFDPHWPFGFEVFLTEAWILDELDANTEGDLTLLEDATRSVMGRSLSAAGQVFGAQLPFAVYDGVKRGVLPEALSYLFDGWKTEPRELVEDLGALWRQSEAEKVRLARAVIEVSLDPPVAPPSRIILGRWVAG